jgi:hypothetical protein
MGRPATRKIGTGWLVALIGGAFVGIVVLGIIAASIIGHDVGAVANHNPHEAKVGDCAAVTGTTASAHYEVVACGSARENYTVGKVLDSTSAKCPDGEDSYYEKNLFNFKLCLIPIFTDGECYEFDSAKPDMGYPRINCNDTAAVRVKVITGIADKNACGAKGADHTLVYAETKTTICLSPPARS